MSKLIPMEQAAAMLGMSVDQINELRTKQEIFGYKDGGTWKFKKTELERVADNLGISLGGAAADAIEAVTGKTDDIADGFGDFDFGDSEELLLDDDSSADALQLDIEESSSVELIKSGRSSDIFTDFAEDGVTLEDSGLLLAGTSKELDAKDDDELLLADSGELKLEDSGSLKLEDSGLSLGDGGLDLAGSGLDLASSGFSLEDSAISLEDSGILELGTGSDVGDDDQLSFGTSDISLASGSGKSLSAEDTGSDILSGGEKADANKPPSTGKLVADDDLLLSDDDLFDDDLILQDSASFEDSSDLGSDLDGDLILEDSDSSSDLSLEANESGISLSANESGILLADEPLELGGSDIDQLELPGDDDLIMLDDSADPEAATMMQEDDFNLTPLEESLDDGSSSQIIALEDSEIFTDESEATILGDADAFSEPALLDDGYAQAGVGVGMGAAGAAMIPGMMADDSYTPPAPTPEAEYSIGSLLGLVLAASVLLLGSLLAFDTCRNLWMDDGQVVGSGFLDMVVTAFGMKN